MWSHTGNMDPGHRLQAYYHLPCQWAGDYKMPLACVSMQFCPKRRPIGAFI